MNLYGKEQKKKTTNVVCVRVFWGIGQIKESFAKVCSLNSLEEEQHMDTTEPASPDCFAKPSSIGHADDLLLHLKNSDQFLSSDITPGLTTRWRQSIT